MHIAVVIRRGWCLHWCGIVSVWLCRNIRVYFDNENLLRESYETVISLILTIFPNSWIDKWILISKILLIMFMVKLKVSNLFEEIRIALSREWMVFLSILVNLLSLARSYFSYYSLSRTDQSQYVLIHTHTSQRTTSKFRSEVRSSTYGLSWQLLLFRKEKEEKWILRYFTDNNSLSDGSPLHEMCLISWKNI